MLIDILIAMLVESRSADMLVTVGRYGTVVAVSIGQLLVESQSCLDKYLAGTRLLQSNGR